MADRIFLALVVEYDPRRSLKTALIADIVLVEDQRLCQERLSVMHQFDTDGTLHIESENADELFATNACESQAQRFDCEKCLALLDLLDQELVNLIIKLHRMKPALRSLAIDELELRVSLTCLDRYYVFWFQEAELSQGALEVMDSGNYLCYNSYVFVRIFVVESVRGFISLQLDARLNHELLLHALRLFRNLYLQHIVANRVRQLYMVFFLDKTLDNVFELSERKAELNQDLILDWLFAILLLAVFDVDLVAVVVKEITPDQAPGHDVPRLCS